MTSTLVMFTLIAFVQGDVTLTRTAVSMTPFAKTHWHSSRCQQMMSQLLPWQRSVHLQWHLVYTCTTWWKWKVFVWSTVNCWPHWPHK